MFTFSYNDINKFIFLLRIGVYSYEYMDDWENFNETSLPKKKEFCSNLNMEGNTDGNCMQIKESAKILKLRRIS